MDNCFGYLVGKFDEDNQVIIEYKEYFIKDGDTIEKAKERISKSKDFLSFNSNNFISEEERKDWRIRNCSCYLCGEHNIKYSNRFIKIELVDAPIEICVKSKDDYNICEVCLQKYLSQFKNNKIVYIENYTSN
jgi:hypothetical protein